MKPLGLESSTRLWMTTLLVNIQKETLKARRSSQLRFESNFLEQKQHMYSISLIAKPVDAPSLNLYSLSSSLRNESDPSRILVMCHLSSNLKNCDSNGDFAFGVDIS
ncbi:hypothetical protein Tco_0026049 [Tanacetum coccineum]